MGGVGKACYLTLTLCAGAAYPTLRFDDYELTEVGFFGDLLLEKKMVSCFRGSCFVGNRQLYVVGAHCEVRYGQVPRWKIWTKEP